MRRLRYNLIDASDMTLKNILLIELKMNVDRQRQRFGGNYQEDDEGDYQSIINLAENSNGDPTPLR